MAKKTHAVGVIFEDLEGNILVLRRHADDPEGGKWGLVGGKLDPGEDKISAALREVEEEIGHQIDRSKLQFLQTYHWDRDDLDITFEVFKLKAPRSDITVELDHTESSGYKWASPQELYSRHDLMLGLYPIIKDEYILDND